MRCKACNEIVTEPYELFCNSHLKNERIMFIHTFYNPILLSRLLNKTTYLRTLACTEDLEKHRRTQLKRCMTQEKKQIDINHITNVLMTTVIPKDCIDIIIKYRFTKVLKFDIRQCTY